MYHSLSMLSAKAPDHSSCPVDLPRNHFEVLHLADTCQPSHSALPSSTRRILTLPTLHQKLSDIKISVNCALQDDQAFHILLGRSVIFVVCPCLLRHCATAPFEAGYFPFAMQNTKLTWLKVELIHVEWHSHYGV